MTLKDKLPVSYLLFTNRGRIDRQTYWTASIFTWTAFYILFNILEYGFTYSTTWAIYPLLFWTLIATATKRLHDVNISGYWILLILIAVFGPIILFYLLGFKKGNVLTNKYGVVPGSAPDYFTNGDGIKIPHLKTSERIINDVTQLNPILVARVEVPQSVDELQNIITHSERPVCIGGGRFSMGGQTASPNSIHVDMRKLNKLVDFSAVNKTIKIEAGARWCDIQQFVDKHNLSVKIMQTYANFTIGGSLSVNVHGRYIGLGPLILAVKSLDIILANGNLVHTSRSENPELFYACIGCYNAIAVIARAEFDLVENVAVRRIDKKMALKSYKTFFFKEIRNNNKVVFHNADIYPTAYKNIRAVSWINTDKKPTEKARLMPLASSYPIERYFIGAFSKSKFGKWRRQYIIDPILYMSKKIHWRNYEAGYDVAELEPESRNSTTYVLQEYFIPVDHFDEFSGLMAEIFMRNNVNVINVSIRHALKDAGSLMAWARNEVFAFVVWYKQRTDDVEKGKVAFWTRELVEAALLFSGSYYLPYQVHATREQFLKAYPNAEKLMDLKSKLDPDHKFRNVIWDNYYQPSQILK